MARSESATGGRLWGIDLIAGIYAIATLLMVWLFFIGTGFGVSMAVVLGPICLLLAVGIAARVNWVRILLLGFLALSLLSNAVMVAYLLGALIGIWTVRPNVDPLAELLDRPMNIALTLLMYFYLRRADVRAAFQKPRMKPADDQTLFEKPRSGDSV